MATCKSLFIEQFANTVHPVAFPTCPQKMITVNVDVNFQCAHPQAVAMFVQFIRFAIALPAHLLAPPHPHPSSMLFLCPRVPLDSKLSCRLITLSLQKPAHPHTNAFPTSSSCSSFPLFPAGSLLCNSQHTLAKRLAPARLSKDGPVWRSPFTCYLRAAIEPRGFPFCVAPSCPPQKAPRRGAAASPGAFPQRFPSKQNQFPSASLPL
jgi:hypothetical protein